MECGPGGANRTYSASLVTVGTVCMVGSKTELEPWLRKEVPLGKAEYVGTSCYLAVATYLQI